MVGRNGVVQPFGNIPKKHENEKRNVCNRKQSQTYTSNTVILLM